MTDLVAVVVAGQVLAQATPSGPVLPGETASGGWPDLEQLAVACGASAVEPLAPAVRAAGDPALTVHLVVPDAVPAGLQPLEAAALDRLGLPASAVTALRTELAVLRGAAPWPPRRPEWFRPSWRQEVDAWVDGALDAAGLRRHGPSQVAKLWSLSAVLRVPVAGELGSVFLKAVGDHFRAEPTVTAWLDRIAPGRVPSVLAVEPDRGWMLMRRFTGVAGDEQPTSAPQAARTLASLQLATVGRTGELLGAGAPDRSSGPTLHAFTEVVRSGLDLELLDPDERRRLHALPDWVAGRLAALEATGMPACLVHGDLHAGNYVVAGDRVLLFDWTDAALGQPVQDAVLLAGSAGRTDAALEAATLRAWAEVWRTARPDVDVARALEVGPAVHQAYQAVSYDLLNRAQEDRSRWELRGVTARCLRRLLALHDTGIVRELRNDVG